MAHVGLGERLGMPKNPIRTDTCVKGQTREPDKNQEGNS